MFCGNKSHNKGHNLIEGVTFDFLSTTKIRGNEKGDDEMRDRVGDFNKLIALEV